MRSLKVIIFRDTDKPYTIIVSSAVIVFLVSSAIILVSLLTFSFLGNIMLVGQPAPADGGQQFASGEIPESGGGAEEPSDGGEEQGVDTESGAEPMVGEAGSETDQQEESVAAGAQPDAEPSPDRLEDWAAPNSPFITILLDGPTVLNNRIRYRVRVEKAASQLGINASGRFVAALVRNDGRIGPTFPADIVTEGLEITNPRAGLLFRIAYRRDISVEFGDANLEDFSALALFVFDSNETKQLLWQKLEPIRR